ncbi:unnamed protein product [Notodromas monacha]|uniref:Uncharacterized protein n=1 Tax=Notodromas monacha TaxID=399045 RepID=A0A7R9BQP2_9CRUS|nr:unnamed protein product [Notodromas monacha]CAG0918827.1 unnamed protein product [Notodromas monacha]
MMSAAYLMRLDFGLRDLSYLKLEISDSAEGSPEQWEMMRKNKTSVECYLDKLEDRAHDVDRIPFHFHRSVDGIKIGSPCGRSSWLKKVFTIRDDANGAFVLTTEEKPFPRLFSNVVVFINQKRLCFDRKTDFTLKHGDVIESFNVMRRLVPVCREFFELLRAGGIIWTHLDFRLVLGILNVPFGHLDDFCKVVAGRVQKLTMDFSIPDGMKAFVPRDSSRSFFKYFHWENLKMLEILALEDSDDSFRKLLVENGKVFSHLEKLLIHDHKEGNSFLRQASTGKLVLPACEQVTLKCALKTLRNVDMRLVFPRLKELHLMNIAYVSNAYAGQILHQHVQSPTIQEFIATLGSQVLSSLHDYHLPAKMDKNSWTLAQIKGTFMNLESLGLHGEFFDHVPIADKNRPIMLNLKSLWLKDVFLTKVFQHLRMQTSLEKLWIRNYRSQATESSRRICQDFLDSPKQWVKNLKYVSADLWETYIPYENLHQLECVAFFFRCKAAVKFAKRVFEKLRSCSKLQGLILRVRDDLELRTLDPLPQNLEFAAFTGTNRCSAMAALDFIRRSRDSLQDLWIQTDHVKDLEELIPALKHFSRLKNVVFVDSYDEDGNAINWFETTLKERVDPTGALKQVTLFSPSAVDSEFYYSSCTFNTAKMEEADFSLEFVTRFYIEWLKFIPDKEELGQLSILEIKKSVHELNFRKVRRESLAWHELNCSVKFFVRSLESGMQLKYNAAMLNDVAVEFTETQQLTVGSHRKKVTSTAPEDKFHVQADASVVEAKLTGAGAQVWVCCGSPPPPAAAVGSSKAIPPFSSTAATLAAVDENGGITLDDLEATLRMNATQPQQDRNPAIYKDATLTPTGKNIRRKGQWHLTDPAAKKDNKT